MSQLTSLVEMRDAIRIGSWLGDLGIFEHREHMFAFKAFNGSLDAARALHEELLPGWGKSWFQWDGNAIVEIWEYEDCEYKGVDSDLARAWLLAILEALIAKEKE